MKKTIQYLVDEKGFKTSVIVPYENWEKMNSDYKKLQHKIEVFTAIQDGLGELKTAKRTGKKLQTLSGFLNESNS
jgi:hypothetical protein